jgi:DNA-binding NarL/FixJ family response regulator
LKPEVALLDLHLGSGPTGLDLAVELRRILPKIGIVILTSFEDPRLLNPNLPDPPRGSIYLNKKSVNDTQVLVTALTSSTDSSTWNSPNSSKIGLPGAIGDLTDVQLETLRLMAQGLSNAEIAKRRFVTEKSVETAIARLAKIMGVESDPSRNQRVHMAKVYFRALGIDPGGEH